MSSQTPAPLKKQTLKQRISQAFRPSNPKTPNKLSKRPPAPSSTHDNALSKTTTTTSISKTHTPRLHHGAIYRPTHQNAINDQTGEIEDLPFRGDTTELLHGLGHRESQSSLESVVKEIEEVDLRPPGEGMIASLPTDIWRMITDYLSPCTAANLAISSKTLHLRLNSLPFQLLDDPENKKERIAFLLPMDRSLPNHLFCFSCAKYHLRLNPGSERLHPTITQPAHPIYHCPSIGKPGYTNHRMRITPGNTLPFTHVQLILRSNNFSPKHGVPPNAFSKRWKDTHSEWSHQSNYLIHKNHLLLRVSSKTFANANLPPSGARHLLYSREDYTPYFSTCAHWRDGELMNICKCALSHIPERRESITAQLAKGPKIVLPTAHNTAIVSLCGFCRPMRRCPDCKTEYLVELKLGEDREEGERRFRQVLVVTRWSDLGDGRTPFKGEWAAVCGNAGRVGVDDIGDGGGVGEDGEEKEIFDSFKMMGRRAISGIFESQKGVSMPGQRMLSLNPSGERKGEEGHGWY